MEFFKFPTDLFLEEGLLRKILKQKFAQDISRYPHEGETLLYTPSEEIFSGYKIALFTGDDGKYFLFKPGNRIKSQTGLILTLRANGICVDKTPTSFYPEINGLLQKKQRRINKSLDVEESLIGTIYGHDNSYSRINAEDRIPNEFVGKFRPDFYRLESNDNFEFVSMNINREPHKLEKRVSMKAPAALR